MDIEFSTPQEIKAFQEEKLATALQYLKANSPYYKRMFAENNIDIDKSGISIQFSFDFTRVLYHFPNI